MNGLDRLRKSRWNGRDALISFPPQPKSLKGRTGYPCAAQGVQSHCGARNRTPLSLVTRRISTKAACGLGTCSKTQIVHVPSNSLVPSGRRVAEPCTNLLWKNRFAVGEMSRAV